jgi:hypothetical protein
MKLRIATFVIGFTSAILSLSQKPAQTQAVWHSIGGCAKDIAGYKNSAWVIGCASASDGHGYEIWNWNSGSGWKKVNGGAVRIAVSGNGTPWVVNSKGDIFKRVGTSWKAVVDGCATDIGVGGHGDGSPWVIGCAPASDGHGYEIFQLKSDGSQWVKVNGGAVRIAVSEKNNPWVVNSKGDIFKRVGTSWKAVSGCAKDIGVGETLNSVGTIVWVIGCAKSSTGDGNEIWNHVVGTSVFTRVNGGGISISVSPNKTPWVIDGKKKSWHIPCNALPECGG